MSDERKLERRLGAWAAASDDSADWEDVMRRAGERRANTAFSRRRLALALAVVIVLLGSVAALLASFRTGGTTPPSGAGPTGHGATGHGPTGANGATGPIGAVGPTGARRAISIDDLRAEAPFVPLPSSDLANDGKVSTVWVADHVSDPTIPEGQLAAVVNYAASHIRLVWTRGRLDVPEWELRVIAGAPALLIPGGIDHIRVGPTGSTTTTVEQGLSWLYLAVGPNDVLVLQGRVPATELIDVAETLRPSPGEASPPGDLPPADPQTGPNLTFWDGPPFYGIPVSSLADAAGSLAFRPVAPSLPGDPSAIFETDPAQAAPSSRVLSLRYDDKSSGRYWLLERPSLGTTTSLLREIASECTRASGCKGSASMIDLGGGASALDLEDRMLNRLIWVKSGVYYEVVGSASTLRPGQALAVAKAVAAAG